MPLHCQTSNYSGIDGSTPQLVTNGRFRNRHSSFVDSVILVSYKSLSSTVFKVIKQFKNNDSIPIIVRILIEDTPPC